VTQRLGLRSLRWRLAALIGLVVVLAVAGTFVVIYRGTGSQLRDQIDSELRADVDGFDRGGVPVREAPVPQVEETARDYLRSQPYRASNRLLFLRVGGRGVVSNEPKLLGMVTSRDARALLAAPAGYSSVHLSAGDLRVYRTVAQRDGRVVADIGGAEPLAPVQRAQREVRSTFLIAGTATLALALLLGYLVAARTARPLRRMARVAARVDAGDLTPRMPSEAMSRSDEIGALADSFDTMLDRLEDAFARQRAFASDASHELRTPLTVIRGQLEVLARMPNPEPVDVRRVERLVRTEIVRMERLVEDLLVLARADEREFLRRRSIGLRPFCRELLDGFIPTADRHFEFAGAPDGTLDADPDRLAQALRNLLRNAIEHTQPGGLIRLTASATGQDSVTIAVEDDGHGILPAQRERVFDRFHRIDSARDRARGGVGLGLAIVRAVAEAHGGSVSASESPEGGARVQIELPGFTPRSGRPREDEPPGTGPASAPRVRAG
jgi:two-component system, OmpR family, sensor kinase